MRMCVGCREMKEKKALLRIVRNAQGEISFDRIGKAPGRGAYICKSKECLTKAVRQKQLGPRSWKQRSTKPYSAS